MFAISFLPFLSPGDGTTYNIQSGDDACNAVKETGCTYNYYVFSNGTNVVVGVVDFPGMKVLFPVMSSRYLGRTNGSIVFGHCVLLHLVMFITAPLSCFM